MLKSLQKKVSSWFPKNYYFVLEKKIGRSSTFLFLYLDDKKKFKYMTQLYSGCMMNWFQSQWYWFLFNLPPRFRRNGSMFAYPHTTGTVLLKSIVPKISAY